MYSSFYSRKTLLRVCSVMMFEINILNTIEQLNETFSLILSCKAFLRAPHNEKTLEFRIENPTET